MNPGNTAQGRRTRGQHQWSPSPRHAHMITPDHEDEESLLSLYLSCPQSALDIRRSRRNRHRCRRPRRTFLRSPHSMPLSAQALKSDRRGAARRRGAKRRTAEKTPTTIDHSNGGGERRGREREGALCRKTSHQGRERELKWRRPHPVSQSFNPASK